MQKAEWFGPEGGADDIMENKIEMVPVLIKHLSFNSLHQSILCSFFKIPIPVTYLCPNIISAVLCKIVLRNETI